MSDPRRHYQSINFLALLSAALSAIASAAPSITLSKKTDFQVLTSRT